MWTDDRPARFRWDEMADETRRKVLDWVVSTCLLFGVQRKTAYLVASAFAEGLDRDLEEASPSPSVPEPPRPA